MIEKISWSSFKSEGNGGQYLMDAFNSGWVSGGPYLEKFEKMLESIFIGSHCLAVSNGTSALQLAFQTLGLRSGDEVIVPAFCFQAAANVLHQLGAIPVFCDVNNQTWNVDVESISSVITERTVGIVIVHNYGRAAPAQEIVALANERKLWVVEDCAEAWFGRYKDKYLGQFGVISTFSMHATKTISCGEGGVVLVNDSSLVERAKLLRSHGLKREKTHYLHDLPGNNYRLSNLLCAIALGQLEQYECIVSKQFVRMMHYQNRLNNHWGLSLQSKIFDSDDKLWATAIRIKTHFLSLSRDHLISLLTERGVEVRPGFYPASSLEYNKPFLRNGHPVADIVAKEIIVLPCSPDLTERGIDYVCDTLLKILSSHRKKNIQMYEFEDLKNSHTSESVIAELISGLGAGLKYFRYFQSRTFEATLTHDVSIAMRIEGRVVGYGHIETVDNVTWLGIAITERDAGAGLGDTLISELILRAKNIGIQIVNLRVDRENFNAIKLYESVGFKHLLDLSNENALHMQLNILN